MNIQDILVKRYRDCAKNKQPHYPYMFDVIYTYGLKVGEFFMLTELNRAARLQDSNVIFDCHDGNPIKDKLRPYLTDYYQKPKDNAKWVSCHELVEKYDCGNGNMVQQIYRLCGLEVPIKPKGLIQGNFKLKKNRIGLHIEGYTADKMGLRSANENTINSIKRLIKENPQYEFIEFGQRRQFDGAEDFTDKSLARSIRKIGSCDYFICINSGFMHVAACFNIKTIVIIDLPDIQHCYLPMLVNQNPACYPPYNHYDIYWLYPQFVHLHQKDENELVKLSNYDNIVRALNGEIYPFWDDKYLSLINEF